MDARKKRTRERLFALSFGASGEEGFFFFLPRTESWMLPLVVWTVGRI